MTIRRISLVSAILLTLALPLAAGAGPTLGGADADSDGLENAGRRPAQHDVATRRSTSVAFRLSQGRGS